VSVVDVNRQRLAPGETIVATKPRRPEPPRARMVVSLFTLRWQARLQQTGRPRTL
jgi:hypothetical protein